MLDSQDGTGAYDASGRNMHASVYVFGKKGEGGSRLERKKLVM